MCGEQDDMSALIITHLIEEETKAHGSLLSDFQSQREEERLGQI